MIPTRLELDYVAHPRPLLWPGLALLALAVAAAWMLVVRYQAAERPLAVLMAAQDFLPAARQSRRDPAGGSVEEEKRVSTVVQRLDFPWNRIIRAVESASVQNVTLMQMQPETEERALRLLAEAKDTEAMIEFIRRLTAAKISSGVYPVSHRVVVDDPRRPLQFSVLVLFGNLQ